MSDIIIVAVLSLLGTCIGSFGGIIASNRLMTYRIDQLEVQVNKHNKIIERTCLLERDMTTAYKRIDELKQDLKELKHGE